MTIPDQIAKIISEDINDSLHLQPENKFVEPLRKWFKTHPISFKGALNREDEWILDFIEDLNWPGPMSNKNTMRIKQAVEIIRKNP
jgi:hypothetical protein